jgi:hypothetical protein
MQYASAAGHSRRRRIQSGGRITRSYALLLVWKSMSRARVRVVCVAIGVFVVRDINVVV